jgi:uncharacterized membrane protein YbhN (UPF0104 family)
VHRNSGIAASPHRAEAFVPASDVFWLWLRRLVLALAVALAAILLYRSLRTYDPDELLASVLSVPWPNLAAAAGWAAASYVCLTGFDWLGLAYVGRRLPYRKVALASFVSLSIGHNIGVAGLSSGAIRYRYYSREGLDASEVTKLVVLCGTTVALGLMTLAGIALLAKPGQAQEMLHVPKPTLLAIGGACALVPAAYLVLAWLIHHPIRVYRWSIGLPGVKLALAQIVVGATNFACVAACLHQLLSTSSDVGYISTASAFVTANGAALLSHVPGGLGVIESVVVYLVPGDNVLPLVLVFRFIYFLVPLAIGGSLLALTEVMVRRR